MLTFARHALLIAVGSLMTVNANAAPVAKQNSQVPGYYRMALGDLEVTALYDGYIDIDTKLLKGASAEDIQSLLEKMFLDSQNGVQTAVNAFLVNTGKNLVLVDTGAAKCFGPTLGNIQDNLKASGYTPEQVDSVLLTHLHPDHACGLLTADGKAAYPNATLFVPKGDADYWLSSAEQAKAPEAKRGMFSMSQKAVAPYTASEHVQFFSPDSTLPEGVVVVPSNGHTPGHTSYMLSSKGQNLLVWGDIVHSHSVQFSKPEVAIEFDSDSAKAIETRKKLFAEAAKDKLWVAGAHLPFPGIGHVRSEGQGYVWVPTEFGPIRSDR
ncbi:MBL fold metallo-hydrolase [Pseudomonas sp. EL_65y_Pfl2_R95]|uniref:MBL fold metallo-hydrolase n=1 Tax=Pseudomonas sp. EL_65y_Pfl2_R95 TaxID=3088698 RepID=UPI0030DB50D1